MVEGSEKNWGHRHVFIGRADRANERRTWLVIGLTAVMMVVEIAAGIIFGSMALLADGWHMASHAAALGITALGYFIARRHAADERFSFGTGKVGDLAGFSSALLLAVIAVLMAYESVKRLVSPVAISFDEAILVAAVGFAVNLVSALMLREGAESHSDQGHHHDHNIRAAYLHVVADALTSILALAALTAGRFLGWVWLDPVMGVVGAVIIARWSYGLLRRTSRVLLDMRPGGEIVDQIKSAVEAGAGERVSDLHVWRIGPGHFAAVVTLVCETPQPPDHYRERLRDIPGLSHLTLEVNPAGRKKEKDKAAGG